MLENRTNRIIFFLIILRDFRWSLNRNLRSEFFIFLKLKVAFRIISATLSSFSTLRIRGIRKKKKKNMNYAFIQIYFYSYIILYLPCYIFNYVSYYRYKRKEKRRKEKKKKGKLNSDIIVEIKIKKRNKRDKKVEFKVNDAFPLYG